jgi:hypothetical protein
MGPTAADGVATVVISATGSSGVGRGAVAAGSLVFVGTAGASHEQRRRNVAAAKQRGSLVIGVSGKSNSASFFSDRFYHD